jgi:hypothetical protein
VDAAHDPPDDFRDLRDDGVAEGVEARGVQPGGKPIRASTNAGFGMAGLGVRTPGRRVSPPRWETMASVSVVPGLPVTMYPSRLDPIESFAVGVGQSFTASESCPRRCPDFDDPL